VLALRLLIVVRLLWECEPHMHLPVAAPMSPYTMATRHLILLSCLNGAAPQSPVKLLSLRMSRCQRPSVSLCLHSHCWHMSYYLDEEQRVWLPHTFNKDTDQMDYDLGRK
jgi:hypothetical protein